MVNKLHILYTSYTGYPVHIALLSQAEYTELRRHNLQDRQMRLIAFDVARTQDNDPILHILALTNQQRGEAFNDKVEQDVMTWLTRSGQLARH